MNKTPSEAEDLIKELIPLVKNDDVDVVFCVPAIDIPVAVKLTKGTNIMIGAENMYYEEKGAYTGEISPVMLKDAGVEYVILGHSERRQYFGETDEMVNKKALVAFEYGLKPIICVGETLEQRGLGITLEWVSIQVKAALKDLTHDQISNTVIAYEPIWAIGTGVVATKEQAQEVCAMIRKVVEEISDKEAADAMRIQYGGSVSADSAPDLFAMKDIDGGLVGGASLKPDFGAIVNA